MKNEYQKRKAAGQCVRTGCKRNPKLGKDGKRRSYCQFHNEQNRRNTEAFLKRKAAKAAKLVRRKAAPVSTPQAA